MATFVSRSADETRAMGARLAGELPDGTVVALTGELGSGKTTFVQGAAEGMGVARGADDLGETEGVTSPTFVLVREHQGADGRKLIHVDAHRLRGPAELRDLGSDDFLGRRGVAFVEWAERVEGALPEPRLALTAPSGEVWHYGPEDAEESVSGPAWDFALLVTQRRHRADTALVATGEGADRWLDLAQAFAGPAGAGRAPSGQGGAA